MLLEISLAIPIYPPQYQVNKGPTCHKKSNRRKMKREKALRRLVFSLVQCVAFNVALLLLASPVFLPLYISAHQSRQSVKAHLRILAQYGQQQAARYRNP